MRRLWSLPQPSSSRRLCVLPTGSTGRVLWESTFPRWESACSDLLLPPSPRIPSGPESPGDHKPAGPDH